MKLPFISQRINIGLNFSFGVNNTQCNINLLKFLTYFRMDKDVKELKEKFLRGKHPDLVS